MDGQGTTWRRNIAENFNRLSRVHQRYRRQTTDRQTDGRTIAYSENELEFTFAKKHGSRRCRVELVEVTVDDVWQIAKRLSHFQRTMTKKSRQFF